jgi:PTH1 family peptidyl-tRNA hydrolase
VIDRFAQEQGFGPERRKFNALYTEKSLQLAAPRQGSSPRAESVKVFLLKPQTYMNLSGPAVRDCLGFSGVAPAEDLTETLLVVHDDIDLPAGKLRFRARGSAGGHRGVQSILDALGHDRFSRLKIGVGRPEGREAEDYVLAAVDGPTREVLEAAVERAACALPTWIEEGVEASSCRFN